MLLDSRGEYVTAAFPCTSSTNADLWLCSTAPQSAKEEDGGVWPVLLIHSLPKLRLNVRYISPPASFTFCWAVTALCATFPPFSCLFRPICVWILSFPPLLFSSLQPHRGRPPSDPPPQTVIYVQSCPSPLSFHKQEICWAPLSEATRRLLLSNERVASLCVSVGSWGRG